MGIFNKLEFWKKYSGEKDNTGINNEIGIEQDIQFDRTGIPRSDSFQKQQQSQMPEMEHKQPSEFGELSGFEGSSLNPKTLRGNDPFLEGAGSPKKINQGVETVQTTQTSSMQKDIGIISTKIDSIKLILEDIDRRISEIERIAKEE